jgi:photosystem II stability/assembly factor-like uncharacterized protein
MREAGLILFIIIFMAIILGMAYNVASPYLIKLGFIEGNPNAEISNKKDGGVFRSNDFGKTWSHEFDTKGGGDLRKLDVFEMQYDPQTEDLIYISTRRGLYASFDGGNIWIRMNQGILSNEEVVQSFAIDPKNTKRMYIVTYSNGRGRILKTQGEGYYEVYSTLASAPFNKVLGVWVDPFDTSTLFAGVENGVLLESRDFGESWKIKQEFNGAVKGLVMTPGDTRIMYMTVGTGQLLKSRNQGESWDDISDAFDGRSASLTINHIAIDKDDTNRLYAATSNGLYKSQDGGISFFQINLVTSSGLSPSISHIELDPAKAEVLYIGIGSQIHKSDDGGANWQTKTLPTERKVHIIRIKPTDPSHVLVGLKHL